MKRLLMVLLLVASALCALDLSPIGAPTGGACIVMDKGFYVICYRADWKIPQWVAEHVTREQLTAPPVPRKDAFRPDPDLKPGGRAELADYRHSGYDRGHQVPAGDCRYSREAMASTFLLSNMAPQTPQMNQVVWRELEVAVRSLAEHDGDIWIITGPIGVGEKTIGNNRVAVPQSFFKAIFSPQSLRVYMFVIPNATTKKWADLDKFRVMPHRVEELTGLELFRNVIAWKHAMETPMPIYPMIGPDAKQQTSIKKQPKRKRRD